jgi:RNase P/RNase MRP subunit p29
MIPVVAAEYKLVLVGDSAVGTITINKENRLFSVSLSMGNTMNISSPPLE